MHDYRLVRTKVRPIKKLFVLDADDIGGFVRCVSALSTQIGGLFNIFALADGNLRSEVNRMFVERHDPDVVLNLSKVENSVLRSLFRRKVEHVDEDGKKLQHYGTPLIVLSNRPTIERYFSQDDDTKCLFINTKTPRTPEDFFVTLHCGLLEENASVLAGTKFESRPRQLIESAASVFAALDDVDQNILYLTVDPFNSHSYSSSIWEVNYNRENYFQDKSATVVMGSSQNLKSMVYFWNARASYPFAKLMWMPSELAKGYAGKVKGCTHCVVFDSTAEDLAGDIFPDAKRIASARQHFHVFNDDWKGYEHEERQPVGAETILVVHPFDRLFSKEGFNTSFMLDISGLDEAYFPQSQNLGEMFFDLPRDSGSFVSFARIGRRGLSIAASNFAPFETRDLLVRVHIPSFPQLLAEHFLDFGLTLKRTEKTSIAERCLELLKMGKTEELLAEHSVFNAIVELTPKRFSRLKTELLGAMREDAEREVLADTLEKMLPKLTTYCSEKIYTVDEVLGFLGGGTKKNDRLEQIARLYRAGVLLRGKSFSCPSCGMTLWFSFKNLDDEVTCYCCNKTVTVPAAKGDSGLPDAYRLNELVVRAVDQGLLVPLLTHHFFSKQAFRGICCEFCLEVAESPDAEAVSDIDMIVKLGSRIGLVEVKTMDCFSPRQTDRLLEVADKIRAEFVAFASIQAKSNEHIKALYDDLLSRELRIPAFILTDEVLFSERAVSVGRYFEVRQGNVPLSGPQLLACENRKK